MITVKVAELGQRSEEFLLEDGANVSTALSAAKKTTDNKDVRIDGSNVDTARKLKDGDVISLVPRVKGGRS